jgi:hypothetical protein
MDFLSRKLKLETLKKRSDEICEQKAKNKNKKMKISFLVFFPFAQKA